MESQSRFDWPFGINHRSESRRIQTLVTHSPATAPAARPELELAENKQNYDYNLMIIIRFFLGGIEADEERGNHNDDDIGARDER